VTYWDQLGWPDPFGDPAFAVRQGRYAENLGGDAYTPQLVVDGTSGFPGGRDRALDAIDAAAGASKGRVAVQAVRVAEGSVEVEIEAASGFEAGAELVVALTQSGLQSKILRGENAGKSLTHAAVVRSLRVVPLSRSATVKLARQTSWGLASMRVVAFVQARGQRRVIGAATAAVPDDRAPGRR
jgi:hypothetical protein